MGRLKREYLNSEEKNFYMISKAFIETIEGQRNLDNKITSDIWVEWSKRGMITPGMQKNLKLVHTYLKKFCYEIEENLNSHELSKLNKQLMKFDYKLIDDYTVKKLLRDVNDHIKYAVIEREKLEDVLVDIAEVRCVGCKSDYRGCAIYKLLDDISTPYLGEEPNCPYAADLSEFTPEQKKKVEETKVRLKKKNRYYKE
ncbi:DUF5651 domain-containing protein [Clostridium paraputrificum]|uniref:DUF5651 domain-containing protein n=1 Tax=Clostridium TaxID=1485 RepID=UPI0012E1037C|nr:MULTISPECIES: DUF5651 domain-containing protein [Clostridium]MDB2089416.1 DUF5651 domain-containing protein [Clostridium paraputrificum]MDB2096352.1 DUF5651 domain-containing protein [Clostridium paraputrificum]MDU1179977.1 DUF5651 domain-containing protein [Clostridium sp.]MDU1226921.1 DUF5651 domain-containing protein [Clostridium sp.]MDU7653106.1 DUF5651 domain-containing protein [Clostridium sp.]